MRLRYPAFVRTGIARAIFFAVGIGAVLFAVGYGIISKKGRRDWMHVAGRPVFIAEDVTLEEGQLILSNALQLDPDTELSDKKSVPVRAQDKYLVFYSDWMTTADLIGYQSVVITRSHLALSSNLVASHMGRAPLHENAPSGTISFAKVTGEGTLEKIQSGDVFEIFFRYDYPEPPGE